MFAAQSSCFSHLLLPRLHNLDISQSRKDDITHFSLPHSLRIIYITGQQILPITVYVDSTVVFLFFLLLCRYRYRYRQLPLIPFDRFLCYQQFWYVFTFLPGYDFTRLSGPLPFMPCFTPVTQYIPFIVQLTLILSIPITCYRIILYHFIITVYAYLYILVYILDIVVLIFLTHH